MDTRRTAVHSPSWHPLMVSELQSGTQLDLLVLLLLPPGASQPGFFPFSLSLRCNRNTTYALQGFHKQMHSGKRAAKWFAPTTQEAYDLHHLMFSSCCPCMFGRDEGVAPSQRVRCKLACTSLCAPCVPAIAVRAKHSPAQMAMLLTTTHSELMSAFACRLRRGCATARRCLLDFHCTAVHRPSWYPFMLCQPQFGTQSDILALVITVSKTEHTPHVLCILVDENK